MLSLRFMRMSIASVLEYRADFISRVVVGAIWNVTILAFAMVLVTRFPGMGGWAPGDVLLIAAIRTAGHTISTAFFFGMREVSHLVHEGLIDAFLLRPASVYRQVSLNYFHVPVLGDILVVPTLFGVALSPDPPANAACADVVGVA
jgi:ABC-2 type transport system permease protein